VAGLEPLSLAVIGVCPLVTWYVLDDELAVTAHADHHSARGTVSGVTRQQTGVTAAVRAGAVTRLLTLLTRVTSLVTYDMTTRHNVIV